MAVSDFKPFASGGAANVESQATWASESGIQSNGFTAGIATSAQFNKAMRQVSSWSAMFGQMCLNAGINALDDGNITNLMNSFWSGLQATFYRIGYSGNAGLLVGTISSGTSLTQTFPTIIPKISGTLAIISTVSPTTNSATITHKILKDGSTESTEVTLGASTSIGGYGCTQGVGVTISQVITASAAFSGVASITYSIEPN